MRIGEAWRDPHVYPDIPERNLDEPSEQAFFYVPVRQFELSINSETHLDSLILELVDAEEAVYKRGGLMKNWRSIWLPMLLAQQAGEAHVVCMTYDPLSQWRHIIRLV